MKRNLVKIIIAIVAIVAVYSLLSHYGVTDYLKRDNIPKIKEKIDSFGPIAPLVYIGFYILATVFFLPGLPVTMLSGLAFGPIWGVVYASIGAVIGVSCAFLIARYVARGMVEGWVQGNAQFRRIDEGVQRQGWRMLMITRLIPLFPFNLQNYAYGLTKIRFLDLLFRLMDLHAARHRCLRSVGCRGERWRGEYQEDVDLPCGCRRFHRYSVD